MLLGFRTAPLIFPSGTGSGARVVARHQPECRARFEENTVLPDCSIAERYGLPVPPLFTEGLAFEFLDS